MRKDRCTLTSPVHRHKRFFMPRPKNLDTEEGRRRREEKYQRILDASLTVFSQKGFAEAKISEVAETAGVADGTIYLYFKNKDDLLISLFEEKLEAINAGLREALAPTSEPLQALAIIIKYHLDLAIHDPSLTAFITIELRRSAAFMKDYAKEQLAEYLGQWQRVLQQGQQDGIFNENLSTSIMKHILFGALDHTCGVWVNNPNRDPADLREVGEQLTELFVRGLAA